MQPILLPSELSERNVLSTRVIPRETSAVVSFVLEVHIVSGMKEARAIFVDVDGEEIGEKCGV